MAVALGGFARAWGGHMIPGMLGSVVGEHWEARGMKQWRSSVELRMEQDMF